MTDAIATLKSLEVRLRAIVDDESVFRFNMDRCDVEEAAAVIGALAEAMSEPSDEANQEAVTAFEAHMEYVGHHGYAGVVESMTFALKAANAVQLEKIAESAALKAKGEGE